MPESGTGAGDVLAHCRIGHPQVSRDLGGAHPLVMQREDLALPRRQRGEQREHELLLLAPLGASGGHIIGVLGGQQLGKFRHGDDPCRGGVVTARPAVPGERPKVAADGHRAQPGRPGGWIADLALGPQRVGERVLNRVGGLGLTGAVTADVPHERRPVPPVKRGELILAHPASPPGTVTYEAL